VPEDEAGVPPYTPEAALATLAGLFPTLPPADTAHFAQRLAVFLASGEARRRGQLEYQSWADFLRMDGYSASYRRIWGDVITRFASASQPETESAILTADPALARTAEITTRWMNGIQFYLREPRPLGKGPLLFVDSAWGIGAVSQAQFWTGLDPGLVRRSDRWRNEDQLWISTPGLLDVLPQAGSAIDNLLLAASYVDAGFEWQPPRDLDDRRYAQGLPNLLDTAR
jgi:hypothetical protein